MANLEDVTAALDTLGVKTCLACGKLGVKSLCSRCRSVSFCGAACQKAAWPGHKKECKRIVREKAEAEKAAAEKKAATERKKEIEARVKEARKARLLDGIAAAGSGVDDVCSTRVEESFRGLASVDAW